jgi:exodeoxyribonuclease VII large subunit
MTDSLRPNLHEFSVSELSQALKRTLEDAYGLVRVRGEITGAKRAASGHLYLALKDQDALIDGIMWKGQAARLRFDPVDGLEVVATGKLTTYPGRSKYQLVIEQMEPAGIGALLAVLEDRKRKLAAEGLFDPSRKRPLPHLPASIGIVTSPTGAVIRDILHRLADRFPRDVLVWPVLVQGEGAAAQIAAAIKGFNALGADTIPKRPDLLIIARGGGSIEDLWAFNEEIVVRAAADSTIPLISAVGHETDTTLIDFVSDRRAPTPTAAAEFAVPVRADLIETLDDLGRRLGQAIRRNAKDHATQLDHMARRLGQPDRLLDVPRQKFDLTADRLPRALLGRVQRDEARLARLAGRLAPGILMRSLGDHQRRTHDWGERLKPAVSRRHQDALVKLSGLGRLLESFSYRSVLGRGFALVRDDQGRPIADGAKLAVNTRIDIEFRDGTKSAVIGAGIAKAAPRKRELADDTQPRLID